MLSAKERALTERVFAQGPGALVDEGFDADQVNAFMERAEVQSHLRLLKKEFDMDAAFRVRNKFMAKRALSRLVPSAVTVLHNALLGPEYEWDEKRGCVDLDHRLRPILKRPEPTQNQLGAAELVLQGIGIQDFRLIPVPTDEAELDTAFNRATLVPHEVRGLPDPREASHVAELKAGERERVRTVIQQLAPKVAEARENLVRKKSKKRAKKAATGYKKKAKAGTRSGTARRKKA